jgi:hypothetical protein
MMSPAMSPVFPSAERVAPSSVTGPARGPPSRAGARRCGHVRASRIIRREHEDCTCACTRTAGCRSIGDTTARRSGCVTHSCTCTYDARESVGALFRRRSFVVSWRQSAPCASHTGACTHAGGCEFYTNCGACVADTTCGWCVPPSPRPSARAPVFACGQTLPRHRGNCSPGTRVARTWGLVKSCAGGTRHTGGKIYTLTLLICDGPPYPGRPRALLPL